MMRFQPGARAADSRKRSRVEQRASSSPSPARASQVESLGSGDNTWGKRKSDVHLYRAIIQGGMIDVDVAFQRLTFHLHRSRSPLSECLWKPFPTRSRRPRLEAPAIRLPFSMNPIPPNIHFARAADRSHLFREVTPEMLDSYSVPPPR